MAANELEKVRQRLPIFQIRNRLITEIVKNQTLILLGETGCGKTTQIPQYLNETHLYSYGMIACTQPRRVAAISVAQRVANETNTEIGDSVGYCVRFEDVTSPSTHIKYVTDGMLLREAINDPLLSRYAVVILDEVHERTIHTDVLLGVVKSAQRKRSLSNPKRKPLKVILMSATMDVDEFSVYFDKAPVLYLEGRQFSVDVFHISQKKDDYIFSAISTVLRINQTTSSCNNDVLLFMTGQEEIESTVRTLQEFGKTARHLAKPMLVLPLYAALPSNKQMCVFAPAPAGFRKVIVSTNLAETSITIRGIKYVIDTGMIKGKLYTPQNNLEILKVHKISKSQAWQRTGRAGRESAGICYRLFTEKEYNEMPLNVIPEILRSNLLSVALQLIALGIDDLFNFDFMNKPSAESLNASLKILQELGAVQQKCAATNELLNGDQTTENAQRALQAAKYELTSIGKTMAYFPLDPKHSRCVLSAEKLGCVDDILKILSVLSVENIFHSMSHTSSESTRDKFQNAQQKFMSPDGDHVTLLNVYKAFVANKCNKEWCFENNLDFKNLQLSVDIYKQLREICIRKNIKVLNTHTTDTVNLRRALVAGFFVNAAEFSMDNQYKTIMNKHIVQIHPSSVLFNSKPTYVLYNELVKTNKTYMRDLSVISCNWLNEVVNKTRNGSPEFGT